MLTLGQSFAVVSSVQLSAVFRLAADRTYNAQEVLRILLVDKDSNKEGFDESETSICKLDLELDIKQDDEQEENSLENEVSTLSIRGQTISRNSTI